MDEAFSLLQEMREQGLAPNRVTYSALINACGRAGQLARAFQTLDEMCKTGIEPNVVTWTTLIDACGKGKVSRGGGERGGSGRHKGVSRALSLARCLFLRHATTLYSIENY